MDDSILDTFKNLSYWNSKHENTHFVFENKHEILFAFVFSLIEYSQFDVKKRDEDIAQLKLLASNANISNKRQEEIIQKVRIACCRASDLFKNHSRESFITEYVELCLHDKKIKPAEYKILYIVGQYLNLSKKEVAMRLRNRLLRMRYRAILFFEKPWVHVLITFLIILNSIQIALMCSPYLNLDKFPWFRYLDWIFLGIFSLEVLGRILAFRMDFFKETQNVFDFIIIAISWLPLPGFKWISAIRIFRSMLLFNRLGQLKAITKSFFIDALPSIGWIAFLLVIIFFICSVFATKLWGDSSENFRSFEKSVCSLFQLMTLEGWPEMVMPIVEKSKLAWLFFAPFMLVTSYILMNLIFGVIVTSMHDVSLKKKSVEKQEIEQIRELNDRMVQIAQQISNLQRILKIQTEKDDNDSQHKEKNKNHS